MITLNNVTLRRGSNVLLKDINWAIYHKQRIGIIGANGAGKTSLFQLLLDQLEPDKGTLEKPRHIKLAHVAQETPALTMSALDFVLDGDTELRALEKELLDAEEKNNGEKIALLHARLGEIDAYSASARAGQLLNGLGFLPHEINKSVSDFSGGWRVRLNLAQALMSRSDVLLLDEPTNHLDLDAVVWLENWLVNYPGTLLLISHDRDFLDSIVDHIAYLYQQQLRVYVGHYSAFEKQRAEQLLIQQAHFEKQQKHIAHLQSFITRFKAKASKARQAQSRMKAIEKLTLVNEVKIESSFQFEFKPPQKCPNPLIRIADGIIAYGEKTILKDLNLSITPQDRIALLGPNGAGKSSLIKVLAGELTLATGVRTAGDGLKIGYFAQHQVDHLQLAESPLDHIKKLAPNHREVELRTFLGSFGFTGTRVNEKVNIFSGGEKSRLALALIVWQQPNLLLLDEPTNHLDMDMRHALSLALQEYQGAMIIVSHDRFLVRTTVDQLYLVADHSVTDFSGDLLDYEKWLVEYRRRHPLLVKENEKIEITKKQQRQLDAMQRELRRPIIQEIKQCEKEIQDLEKQLDGVENTLSDPILYTDEKKQTLQEYLLTQAQIKKKLQETEANWLKACEKLDALE